MLDHMSFSWGLDEVFSINWDGKGTDPDNITIQNSIIGQGLHRHNHSAGGLIQSGGKVSILKSLYMSNKTRNPKVKGVNEFVNNVVYNYGNANTTQPDHSISADGYILGDSEGRSDVLILNNYFVGGPATPTSKTTPFSRGNTNFNMYEGGNYYDNNQNGVLDGELIQPNETWYPGLDAGNFKSASDYATYPSVNPSMSASDAYQFMVDKVGATLPVRDEVDGLMIQDLATKGQQGFYLYRENDLPLANGGLGNFDNAQLAVDTDNDGIPDEWEQKLGLDPNDPSDALSASTDPLHVGYLNIEVYLNSLAEENNTGDFVRPVRSLKFVGESFDVEPPYSKVTITWANVQENEVLIERTEDQETWTTLATAAVNSNEYIDEADLKPNTLYFYRFKSIVGDEESVYASASYRTPAIPTAPEIAGNPKPADGSRYVALTESKSLELMWIGSENTESYEVYWGESEDNLVLVSQGQHTVASFTVTGLQDDKAYFWRVDAVNDKGKATGAVWSLVTEKTYEPQLIGYWSFDEVGEEQDGVLLDQSSFQNHGELTQRPDEGINLRISEGISDGAIDLKHADPSSYSASIPHADHLYLSNSAFTLGFWMRGGAEERPAAGTSAYIFCKGSITKNEETGATGNRFNMEVKDNNFRFAIDNDDLGKDEVTAKTDDFFTGEWVYVTLVRDTENKKLKIYKNSALMAQIDITKALYGIGEESDLVIGNIGELEFLRQNVANSAPFKGQLDEVRLFNYALTDMEIQGEYSRFLGLVAPHTPSPLSGGMSDRQDRATVTWEGGENAISFKIYLGTSADALTLVDEVDGALKTYSFTGLQQGVTYYWKVEAIHGTDIASSEVWSLQTSTESRELIAHYAFDDASQIGKDGSLYANHAEAIGFDAVPYLSAGKFGGAADFSVAGDAAQKRLVAQDAAHITLAQSSFSVSFWMKAAENTYVPSSANNAYILHKGTFSNAIGLGKWFGVQLNHGGNLNFSIDDDRAQSVGGKTDAGSDMTVLFNNEWNHVVATRDYQNKTMSLYFNGELVLFKENVLTDDIGDADRPLEIGNSYENRSYRDQLDDLKLYNYALSAADVQNVFLHAVPVSKAIYTFPEDKNDAVEPKDLVLTWEGDEDSYDVYLGESADNLVLVGEGISTNGYELADAKRGTTYFWRVDARRGSEIAVGDVAEFTVAMRQSQQQLIAYYSFDDSADIGKDYSKYQENANLLGFTDAPYTAAGKVGGAIDFGLAGDAAQKRLSVDPKDHNLLHEQSFTISYWMKGDADTYNTSDVNAYIVHKGSFNRNSGGFGRWFGVQLSHNGNINFAIDDDVNKTDNAVSKSENNLFNGEWNHVVAIRDFENQTTAMYINGMLIKKVENIKTIGIGEDHRPLEIGNSAEDKSYRDLLDEFKMYNYALSDADVWRLFQQNVPVAKATNGVPAHEGTDVDHTELTLSWEGTEEAYNVYLGSSPENMLLIAEAVEDLSYTLEEELDGLKSYYWRVDAVRDEEVAEGDTWTFKTAVKSSGKELIAYYSFDDPAQIGKDFSKYANDAVPSGFDVSPYTENGKSAGAVNFAVAGDAVQKRLEAPSQTHNTLGTQSFSISYWMKGDENSYAVLPSNSANNAYILQKGHFNHNDGGVGKWFGIQLHNNGNLNFSIDDDRPQSEGGKTDASIRTDTYELFNSEWNHVVTTRDYENRVMSIFVNGSLVQRVENVLTDDIGDFNFPLVIGNSTENKSYRDQLDELKIYNYALTDADVERLFNTDVPTAKATAIYPQHEGVGIDFTDVTLQWEGIEDKYNLYIGEAPDQLQLVAEGTMYRTYEWGELVGDNKSYYWRVDAVRDGELIEGEIWTFQTMPDDRDKPIITETTFEVLETAVAGTAIGQLEAWIYNEGVLENWRLATFDDPNGNGIPPVRIDSETGKLYVEDADDFDFGIAPQFQFHVLVNNGEEFVSDPTAIGISVLFVNEGPSFTVAENIDICNYGEVIEIPITGINPGKEADQLVESLSVQTTQNFLFSTLQLERIDQSNAVLRIGLVGDVQGLVALDVTAVDNGGITNGGSNRTTKRVLLNINSIPEIQIVATPSSRVLEDKQVTLTVSPALPQGYTYQWYKNNELVGDLPYVVVQASQEADYRVVAVAPLGCTVEAGFELEVLTPDDSSEVLISNILTPNSDGVNDFWVIKNLELYSQNEVNVFDSRGNLIFNKRNYGNDWNGSTAGGRLATGVYYYKVIVDGKVFTGSINVVNQ
jgi:gliding motility-associated-like protein